MTHGENNSSLHQPHSATKESYVWPPSPLSHVQIQEVPSDAKDREPRFSLISTRKYVFKKQKTNDYPSVEGNLRKPRDSAMKRNEVLLMHVKPG